MSLDIANDLKDLRTHWQTGFVLVEVSIIEGKRIIHLL